MCMRNVDIVLQSYARWVIALVCVIHAGCSPGSTATSAPQDSEYTFPLVRRGATVEHVFTVENTFAQPITIERVTSSCGCTVAHIAPGTVVPAGDSLKVPVKLDTEGKDGKVQSAILLYIKDRAEPLTLRLNGFVHADAPFMVDFGRVKRGTGVIQRFRVNRYPGQPPMRILSTSTKNSHLVTSHHSGESDDFVEVQVALNDDIPYGRFDDVLSLQTNDADAPVKDVRITGYVLTPLEISEKSVHFGVLRPEERIEKNVTLTAPYGEPLELLNVELSRDDAFSWSAKESNGSARHDLTLNLSTTGRVPSDAPPGILKGTLVCRARVGDTVEEGRIELYGLVEK